MQVRELLADFLEEERDGGVHRDEDRVAGDHRRPPLSLREGIHREEGVRDPEQQNGDRRAERGKSEARCVIRSEKLYGLKKGAELLIDKPRPEYANLPKGQVGHGGADYALFDHFFGALRSGAKKAPIDLREGLRMTLPGIYAAESALRGGITLPIRYPWDPDFRTEI